MKKLLRKLFHTLIFSIKYEIKRSMVFFMILGVIGLLFVFGGIGTSLSKGINSITITDEDNSELSKDFISYLEQQNFTIQENAANKITIPSGFENDFYNGNASIQTGFFGVSADELYGYQLMRLGDRNRIKKDSSNLGGSDLVILFIIIMFITAFAQEFYTARLTGQIHFFNNHLNYWYLFIGSHLTSFIIIGVVIVSGFAPLRYLLLATILFFANFLLIVKLKRNKKIMEQLNYINYAFGALLLFAKLSNLRHWPLVDLLFEGVSPIIIIDIIIAIVLLYFVSRCRLTE